MEFPKDLRFAHRIALGLAALGLAAEAYSAGEIITDALAEGHDTTQITQLDAAVGDSEPTNIEVGYLEALADNRGWNHTNLVKARELAIAAGVPGLAIFGFLWFSLDNGQQSPASPAKEEASPPSVEATEDRREDV